MTTIVSTPERSAVLALVAESVLRLPAVAVLRVGIDGIDGAGKTTFADELSRALGVALVGSGRPVIRASVDGFHHPRDVRYRRGKRSPEGFYRDSYDYETLHDVLLAPLAPGGSGRFRRAVFDVDANERVHAPVEQARPGAILLFDGIFLHRPELREQWDLSVFLRVEWPRNHHLRKLAANGPVDPQEGRFRRYDEGQDLYIGECDPAARADIVIDNDDLAAPYVVRSRGDRGPGVVS